VRVLAQRATTKRWLHWDLPLVVEEVGWALSQPGHLKATVDPSVGSLKADDGHLLLDEWGTLLYVEDGGVIRWGGIVALSRPDGNQWVVEASGFGSYPHSRIHRGDYVRYGVDPAQVVKDIWSHIQETPGGNLGVQVVGDSTPVRLGDVGYLVRDGQRINWIMPHKQFQQLYDAGWTSGWVDMTSAPEDLVRWLNDYAGFGQVGWGQMYVGPTDELTGDEESLLAAGWTGGPIKTSAISAALRTRLQSGGWSTRQDFPDDELWSPAQNGRVMVDGDQVVEPAPYRIKPWTASDCGRLIEEMAARAPFEWVERVGWDGETASPQIAIGYPRIGRRRDDLTFEGDANVTALGYEASLADNHANTVVATGAGTDGGTLRREATREDGRLARDFVVADSDMADASVLARVASTEARRRTSLGVKVSSVTVQDHEHARIGSWQVGDDILLRADIPYVGEVEQMLRVMSWALKADGSAVLTTERSDAFLYGETA
jgi:hypothetical protein